MKEKENRQSINDLEIIKVNYGEEMAKFCSSNFSSILEKKGLLSQILLNCFYPNNALIEDIVKFELEQDFIDFISYQYKIINPTFLNYLIVNNLKKAKDFLIKCMDRNYDMLEEVVPDFRELWRWVLSLDAKPKELTIPQYVRAKDGKYYKWNYRSWDNNWWIGRYYCSDNIIISDLNPIQLDKTRYVMLDYFILDLQDKKMIRLFYNELEYDFVDSKGENKKISLFGAERKKIENFYETIELEFKYDSFIESIGKIKEIELVEDEEKKIIKIYNADNNSINSLPIIITLDKDNGIVGYINNNIQKIGDNFLQANTVLEKIEASQVETIGNCCLQYNNKARTAEFPLVKYIGEHFFENNSVMENLDLTQIKKLGNNSLVHVNFNTIDFPRLECIENNCFQQALRVKKINLPCVEWIGDNVLEYNENFKTELPYLPKVWHIGKGFLSKSRSDDSDSILYQCREPEKIKRISRF